MIKIRRTLINRINKYNQGVTCNNTCIDHSALFGHLSLIRLQTKMKFECTFNAIDFAASRGFIDIVFWLHYNTNKGCSRSAMNLAAENGHIEVVKWLHENRTEGCSPLAEAYARRNNHYEISNWLFKNRYNPDKL